MRYIEKFGGWIIDTRIGLLFGCVVLITALLVCGWSAYRAPMVIQISEREFSCIAAEANGLETRCIEYRRIAR